MKINAETVAEVIRTEPLPNRTTFYFDDDLKGFGFYRTTTGRGTWFAEARPISGGSKKRRTLGKLGVLKPHEAREAARKVISSAALGKDLAQDKADGRASPTVNELVAEYIATKAMKESSREFYRIILRTHISPTLGSMKAIAVSFPDVQRAHDKMSKKARYSANRAVALLSAAFAWGGKRGHVPVGFNPASRIDRNKEVARERYLTAEEMAALGDALREAETIGIPHRSSESKHAPKEKNRTIYGPHVTGAIRLLMLTGCRLREILHLRWSEFDATRGFLRLPDSKTGSKIVVLSSAAQAVLEAVPRVGQYVIASRTVAMKNEKPRTDLKKPWAAISDRAGLGDVHLHDLRHTFASVGAGDGMSLPIIGKLLGHADPATTARYAHVDVNPTRAAADVIANKIANAIGGK